MQTFLPYPDFALSAESLDDKRLGKQRVEAYTILRTLEGITKGWANHPAVKMWRGYENALKLYLIAVLDEWLARGYKNTIPFPAISGDIAMPSWLGDPAFHASHRSNLLRKDYNFYKKWAWLEPDDLPYVWPV